MRRLAPSSGLRTPTVTDLSLQQLAALRRLREVHAGQSAGLQQVDLG